MIKLYRILRCESLLPRLRSGPNLASGRFEVLQNADVPTYHLANPFLLLSLLLCLTPGCASGQAAAEVAGATSASATAGSGAKAPSFPLDTTAGDKNKSPHLLTPTVQRPHLSNRPALDHS